MSRYIDDECAAGDSDVECESGWQEFDMDTDNENQLLRNRDSESEFDGFSQFAQRSGNDSEDSIVHDSKHDEALETLSLFTRAPPDDSDVVAISPPRTRKPGRKRLTRKRKSTDPAPSSLVVQLPPPKKKAVQG